MYNKFITLLNNINTEITKNKDIDLIDAGILDSMAVMRIVSDLEETFNIEFDPDDISPESFASVNTIWSLLNKYLENKNDNS